MTSRKKLAETGKVKFLLKIKSIIDNNDAKVLFAKRKKKSTFIEEMRIFRDVKDDNQQMENTHEKENFGHDSEGEEKGGSHMTSKIGSSSDKNDSYSLFQKIQSRTENMYIAINFKRYN